MGQQRRLGVPTLGGTVTEFAPDGAARILFRCAPGLHRVGDGIIIAGLEAQLLQHVGAQWFACLITGTGHGVIRPSGPGLGVLDRQMQALLTGIAIAANKHEARDGHWVVVLDMAEHEVGALWRDADGDCHVYWTLGAPVEVSTWTEADIGAQACEALDEMKKRHRHVELTPAQQVRLALGQKPTRH